MDEKKEKKIDAISAEDGLRIQNASLKRQVLNLQLQLLQMHARVLDSEEKSLNAEIADKYEMTSADRVNPETLKIIRTPKK